MDEIRLLKNKILKKSYNNEIDIEDQGKKYRGDC